MQLESINPKNNRVISSWDIHNDSDIQNILESAHKSYYEWKNTNLSFRINCLDDLASLIRGKSKEFG